MLKLSRRMFLAGAGALAAPSSAALPRPGCQGNAWNLDPARFDLLLAALRDMKTLDFAGFETNIRFLQPQLVRVAEARAAIQQTGLVFIGAHTGLPQADTAGKLVEQARQFDARSLVVSHSGLSPTGQFSKNDLDAKVKALDLAGARAADAGLVLAYHNHQPEFRNSAAEAARLMNRSRRM